MSNNTNGTDTTNEQIRIRSLEKQVDEIKTQIASGKLKGEKGEKGDRGERGYTGSKGDKGGNRFVMWLSLAVSAVAIIMSIISLCI